MKTKTIIKILKTINGILIVSLLPITLFFLWYPYSISDEIMFKTYFSIMLLFTFSEVSIGMYHKDQINNNDKNNYEL